MLWCTYLPKPTCKRSLLGGKDSNTVDNNTLKGSLAQLGSKNYFTLNNWAKGLVVTKTLAS